MRGLKHCFAGVLLVVASASAQPSNTGGLTVLVPIAFSITQQVHGAYDTVWKVEIWVQNGSDQDVQTLQPTGLCAPPCPAGYPSGFLGRLTGVESNRGNGAMFRVPAGPAEHFQFDARFLEITRGSQPTGVSIPIISEDEFLRGEAWLLAVPTDEEIRTTLRVYDPWALKGTTVLVEFISPAGETIASTILLPGNDPLARERDLPPNTVPAAAPTVDAVFDLTGTFPQLREYERFHVRLTPSGDDEYWAMVSVTDNETQHVLLITPEP